jgi:hypothetical protein
VLEAFQPAAMPILLLDGPHVRRDGRLGLAHPADRRDRLRVPFRAEVEAAAAPERPGGSAERSGAGCCSAGQRVR